MTPIVLDASTTVAFLLPDEKSKLATAAVRAALRNGLLVPALWAYEVENALLVAYRRKRVTSFELDGAFAELRTWTVRIEPPSGFGVTASVATRTGLTLYDASYVCVALNSGAQLATLDRKLRDAARAFGASLFEENPLE